MPKTSRTGRFLLTLGLLCLVASGCRTPYYAVMDMFGKQKRDLLRDRIESASTEQQHASDEFRDALTRLKELTAFDGGDLENTYNKLQGEYDQAADRAQSVRRRITAVERVADDLFEEWETEIAQMQSQRLRALSEQRLRETLERYRTLIRSMHRAEDAMQPVLQQLLDQVLYLKHNLNARALGSLQTEAAAIEHEVDALVEDIQHAIREADAFLKALPE